MKKYIIYFVIQLLIISVSVYAGASIKANDVKYIKPNGEETNVSTALTELFNNHITIAREANLASGTTVETQPGDYLIIASVVGPASVTNSELVYEKVTGGSASGVTSDTVVYKATGTSSTITMIGGYRFTYYIIR